MSWYSNILTTTSSRISNLRSTLLGGDADGDTEDDTHVCRVLRAYYTEGGRGFPSWLPPDPKAPPPPVATPVYGQPGAVGSRYGASSPAVNNPNGAGGLSSLWDNNASSASVPLSATSSLRQGRGGPAGRASPFEAQPRPLPSQRMGSYQSTHSTQSAPPSAPIGAGGAQGKLRNLFGASPSTSRTSSPAQPGAAAIPPPAAHRLYNAPHNPQLGSPGPGSGYHAYNGSSSSTGSAGGRRPPIGGGLPSGPRMR